MANIVHVVGTGTIGEPLIGLLCHFAEGLGVDEVTFNKRTPLYTDRSKVQDLIRRGAKLVTGKDSLAGFEKLGMKPTYESEEAIQRASVVIDCTPSGAGLANKSQYYERAGGVLGFIAQGSEFGFGKMYARGINDAALIPGEDRYLHVVSCNTHNLAALIQTLALENGRKMENLVSADFVCMRRANDVSQDDGYAPSPQVGKHKDGPFGTHHARDAYHLFQTLGREYQNLFSSACKLNSQYMHTLRFHLRVQQPTTVEKLLSLIAENDRLAITYKKSANQVFSFGRDHGFFGRILNQTVIPHETLTVVGDRDIYGFCFTPQDGNSLLSSVAGALWAIDPETYESRLQVLKRYFFPEV
jgi:glyceraldehyde-3-phosphate dehydrogenase (NAD(P))